MKIKNSNLAASALTLALVASASAVTAKEKTEESQTKTMDTASSLTVKVDPETGELVPMSSEEAAAMTAAQQRSVKGAAISKKSDEMGKVRYHANGVRSMVLDPSMLQSVIAERAPDGSIKIRHGDHEVTQTATDAPEK